MKKLIYFIFVLLLINISCGAPPIEGKKLPQYKVYIDSSFTTAHKINIVTALEEWHTKTNNVFKYSVEYFSYEKSLEHDSKKNTIYVFVKQPGGGLTGWTVWDTGINNAKIYMSPGIEDSNFFTGVMLHEFGHALNLDHYSGEYLSIMNSSVSYTYNVECIDLLAFCKEWDCTVDCTVQPIPKPEEHIAEPNIETPVEVKPEFTVKENVCEFNYELTKGIK